MSYADLRSEAVRVIANTDETELADLVAILHEFEEQRQASPFDTTSPEVIAQLQQGLEQATGQPFIPHDEVQRDVRQWRTRYSGRPLLAKTTATSYRTCSMSGATT